jgi:hypothetical protein
MVRRILGRHKNGLILLRYLMRSIFSNRHEIFLTLPCLMLAKAVFTFISRCRLTFPWDGCGARRPGRSTTWDIMCGLRFLE